jgi:hypothetical protein
MGQDGQLTALPLHGTACLHLQQHSKCKSGHWHFGHGPRAGAGGIDLPNCGTKISSIIQRFQGALLENNLKAPPMACNAMTTLSICSACRAQMATLAPSAVNKSAVARPIPCCDRSPERSYLSVPYPWFAPRLRCHTIRSLDRSHRIARQSAASLISAR